MAEINVGQHEDAVEVHMGDRVLVRMDENATTGYQWSVVETSDHLDVESSEFSPPGSRAPGAAGQRVVTIRTRHPGSAIVRLHLKRPWEAAAAQSRDIAIRVIGDRCSSHD